MTIGDRIREARKAKGLTQKQLGEACGIAEPTIRRYELGKLNPKFETLQRIGKPLGVSASELYGIEPLPADFLFDLDEQYIYSAIQDRDSQKEALEQLIRRKKEGLTVKQRKQLDDPISELFYVLHSLGYTGYTEEEIMPPAGYDYDEHFICKNERTGKFYISNLEAFFEMADNMLDYLKVRLDSFFAASKEITSPKILADGEKRASEYLKERQKSNQEFSKPSEGGDTPEE